MEPLKVAPLVAPKAAKMVDWTVSMKDLQMAAQMAPQKVVQMVQLMADLSVG